MIEQIDPAATETYLSHAENGMKRSYAERDWARLERAIVELERRLGDVIADRNAASGPEGPPA